MPVSPEPRRAPSRSVVIATAAVGFALLVVLVLLSDGRALLETAARIEPTDLVEPLVFSFLSYAVMARSYQGIAEAAESSLRFVTWLRITLVSNTVNYVVSTAGLSGFAVRMYLLGQHGVASGRAVLISLVQTFLTNFSLLFFIVGGFASLVARGQLTGGGLAAASIALAIFAAVLIYALVLVLHRRLRRLTLLWIGNTLHTVVRRIAPRHAPRRVHVWRFQHNLDQGLQFLLARKRLMLAPSVWICIDWFLTSGVLWAAFRAVQHPLPLGMVLVGFGVGLLFAQISVVPGGLGLMEGAMAAVFVSLGVPLEPAVLAVLIFRLAYHIVPLVVSLFFFRGLFRQALARG